MCRYGWCFVSEEKTQNAQTAQIHTGMECMVETTERERKRERERERERESDWEDG